MYEQYAPERQDELAAEAQRTEQMTTTEQSILAEYEEAM